MSKIKVYIKQPGRVPYSTNISNTLENLQKTVGGYIETVTVSNDLVIICNEEGLINDLPYNCSLLGGHLFGTLVFVGTSGDDFSDIPITFKELKTLFPQLWHVRDKNKT